MYIFHTTSPTGGGLDSVGTGYLFLCRPSDYRPWCGLRVPILCVQTQGTGETGTRFPVSPHSCPSRVGVCDTPPMPHSGRPPALHPETCVSTSPTCAGVCTPENVPFIRTATAVWHCPGAQIPQITTHPPGDLFHLTASPDR